MKGITPEMMEKAKNAKNAEELLALAKENGVAMSEDEAQMYYDQLNPKSGELDDDDLDNVAGGGCSDYKNLNDGDRVRILIKCPWCGAKNPTGTLTRISLYDRNSRFLAIVKADCCGQDVDSWWFDPNHLRKI